MAKGMIITILLIVLCMLGILIHLELNSKPEKPALDEELASLKNPAIPSNDSDNSTAELEEAVAGVSGGGEVSGGGGGGGDGAGGDTAAEQEPPPADLHTAPCGTYFTRYDICTGSCANGFCTKEGRSCYCKLAE